MPVDFRTLAIFGDSLSDNGNLPEPVRPDAPYVNGRFSNGPIYADVLPGELGVRAVNFAFGGAEAAAATDPAQVVINLRAQVAAFENRYGSSGPPDGTAVSLFIGNNDYIGGDLRQGAKLVDRVLDGIDDAAVRLAQTGVDRILLYTLPAISATPYGRALSSAERSTADALIVSHNRGIKSLAETYNESGVPTTVVDINRLTAEIVGDRQTFGLTVLETPLYIQDDNDKLNPTGVTSRADPDEVAYFDLIHPTTVTHAIVAAFTEATIRAEETILRGTANDRIRGNGDDEFIMAGRGNDFVSGAGGADVLFGGRGRDAVYGGLGSDLLSGGGEADRLDGSAGNDLVAGNAGNDILAGRDGNDVLIVGTGLDVVVAGAGNDLVVVTDDAFSGFDRVYGGAGRDTLRLEVSQQVYASEAFQAEIQAFTSGGLAVFRSVGVAARDMERLEVEVDGAIRFAAGAAAVNPGKQVAALLRDADLWGLA